MTVEEGTAGLVSGAAVDPGVGATEATAELVSGADAGVLSGLGGGAKSCLGLSGGANSYLGLGVVLISCLMHVEYVLSVDLWWCFSGWEVKTVVGGGGGSSG
ncbi:hypothetical protein LWI28_001073 [Acer negundo]|uniref:Uncharacterized protein n=1 Tax=Acer negundo TaxID=4023 RepID=A0AAD5NZU9_ACENE|nr:hypothetical protein LWI28_001073 [Acer negundo]